MKLFERNTLLILGAGSNKDIGFPLGSELIAQVRKRFPNTADNVQRLSRVFQGSEKNISEVLKRISILHEESIDEWIKKLPNLSHQLIVKYLVALVMCELERENSIEKMEKNVEKNKSFYRLLSKSLIANRPNVHDLININLKIITFNYERSLEHYIYSILEASYGKQNKNIILEFMNNVEFIHAHGQIGHLPGINNNVKNSMPVEYGQFPIENRNEKDFHEIYDAGEFMYIPGVDGYTPTISDDIKRMIGWSERAYFIGFGYFESNMDLLGLNKDTIAPAKFFGCAYQAKKEHLVHWRDSFGENLILGDIKLDAAEYWESDILPWATTG